MKKMESSEDDSTFLQSSSSSANNPNNEDEYDSLSSMFQYRDRAKERREKHGISAPPLREYEKAYSSASSSSAKSKPEEPLGTTNVGNKLLKGMGWKEGEGLGKSKQGITAPIKVILNPLRLISLVNKSVCLCIVYVVFFGGAGDKFERQNY